MKKKGEKYNKVFFDIFINIFSAGIVAVATQFLLFPTFSKNFSIEEFGDILIMVAVMNILTGFLGISLNNIRLILDREYKNEKISGDFPVLLVFAIVLNVVLFTTVITFLWEDYSFYGNIILIVASVFQLMRVYISVSYRIELNYIKILQMNTIYTLVLIFSLITLLISDLWQLVFLFAELVTFGFLIKTTRIMKEPISITPEFKATSIRYMTLSLSNLIGNLLIYLDRVIIYIFLGPYNVAVYFAATLIGKMSSFVLTPISGVVLSYISKKDNVLKRKEFILINFAIIVFSFLSSILTFFISKPLIKFLYEDLYIQTLEILLIANGAAIIYAASSITQSIVLKYSPTQKQFSIQISYGLIYLILGVALINNYGLLGFSIAALVAGIFKFINTFIIGMKSL